MCDNVMNVKRTNGALEMKIKKDIILSMLVRHGAEMVNCTDFFTGVCFQALKKRDSRHETVWRKEKPMNLGAGPWGKRGLAESTGEVKFLIGI